MSLPNTHSLENPYSRPLYVDPDVDTALQATIEDVALGAFASETVVREHHLRGMELKAAFISPATAKRLGVDYRYVNADYQCYPNAANQDPQLEVTLRGHPYGDILSALLNENGAFRAFIHNGQHGQRGSNTTFDHGDVSQGELLGVIPGILRERFFDGESLEAYKDLSPAEVCNAIMGRLASSGRARSEGLYDKVGTSFALHDSKDIMDGTNIVSYGLTLGKEVSVRWGDLCDKWLELKITNDQNIETGRLSQEVNYRISLVAPGDGEDRTTATFSLYGKGLETDDPDQIEVLRDIYTNSYRSKEQEFGDIVLRAAKTLDLKLN